MTGPPQGDWRPPAGIGYQPAPMNRPPAQPLGIGVQPGSQNVLRARIVIIFGTTGGLFLYNGTPGAGNPPVMWAVPPGVTADPYGNAVSPVLGVGTPGGPQTLIDASGDISLTGSAGTTMSLMPSANTAFSLTGAATGIIQSLMSLGSGDSNQTQAGVVSGITLGTGTSAKMGTLITSPYGTSGAGILLEAQNDGATDTASMLIGTVTTQGGTLTFTPLFAALPGALIGYNGTGTITVNTRTSGSGTISIPAGVSVGVGECWGPGGAGAIGGSGGGGGGGGGGEYAQEPSLALTGGGTAAFTVGAPGSASTLTGSAVTVTANFGANGTAGSGSGGGAGGNHGTGSTNTVHHDGGFGGAGGAAGGGGGGASAGPAAGGGTGGHGSPGGSGQPGIAPSGGANGGQGGTASHAGTQGAAPGGGGGGDGENNASGPAAGRNGQVRLTWTSGAPVVMWSVNGTSAAITDQFGNSIPTGERVHSTDGNTYRTERVIQQVSPRAQSIASTTGTAIGGLSVPVGIGTYIVRVHFILQWNAAAGQPSLQWTGPAISQFDIAGESRQVGSAATTNTNAVWNSGTVSGGGYNSGSQNITQAMTAAGAQFVVDLWGQFVFTAAGTLVLNGLTSVAADTWLVESGWWELQPL